MDSRRAADADLKNAAIKAWLIGGFAAGVLDILDAFVVTSFAGVTPLRVLQAIASGVLGPASYRGGASTALLGLALHFLIAYAAAAVYVVASRRFAPLLRRPFWYGAVFGVGVYLFMNLVVLPLSAFQQGALTLVSLLNGLFAHIVCVGWPIALAARWQLSRASDARSPRR